MKTLLLSLRNIFRNKRRTAITLLAIIFGISALMIFGGYFEWVFWGLKESSIRSQLGHIQIYKKGYLKAGSTDVLGYTISNYKEIKRIILKELINEETGRPYAEIITSQLMFTGIIGFEDKSSVCTAKGVEQQYDSVLNAMDIIKEGYDLTTIDPEGGVIGIGMAAGLGVKPNDYLTILATTKYGGINAVDFKVRGFFTSGWKEYDDNFIKVPLKLAQNMMTTNDVTKILILLDETENTLIAHKKLLKIKEKYKWDIETLTWHDLALYYNQTAAHLRIIYSVVFFIIAGIVIFTISNTVLMNVMERITEIGTIRAIGATRLYILYSFLLEGLWYGIIGGILGIGTGIILSKIINIYGIPVPPPPGGTQDYIAEVLIAKKIILESLALSMVTAFISSIFGAVKASRMKIVDALRHI